jgi:hypothetical protein
MVIPPTNGGGVQRLKIRLRFKTKIVEGRHAHFWINSSTKFAMHSKEHKEENE